jgi:hypothetical protein
VSAVTDIIVSIARYYYLRNLKQGYSGCVKHLRIIPCSDPVVQYTRSRGRRRRLYSKRWHSHLSVLSWFSFRAHSWLLSVIVGAVAIAAIIFVRLPFRICAVFLTPLLTGSCFACLTILYGWAYISSSENVLSVTALAEFTTLI